MFRLANADYKRGFMHQIRHDTELYSVRYPQDNSSILRLHMSLISLTLFRVQSRATCAGIYCDYNFIIFSLLESEINWAFFFSAVHSQDFSNLTQTFSFHSTTRVLLSVKCRTIARTMRTGSKSFLPRRT